MTMIVEDAFKLFDQVIDDDDDCCGDEGDQAINQETAQPRATIHKMKVIKL